jgi:hypothetical protein
VTRRQGRFLHNVIRPQFHIYSLSTVHLLNCPVFASLHEQASLFPSELRPSDLGSSEALPSSQVSFPFVNLLLSEFLITSDLLPSCDSM